MKYKLTLCAISFVMLALVVWGGRTAINPLQNRDTAILGIQSRDESEANSANAPVSYENNRRELNQLPDALDIVANELVQPDNDDEKQDDSEKSPGRQFVDELAQLFEENDIAIFPTTIGSGWNQETRCTTAIINKDIQIWLFSREQDGDIYEIGVIGTYPESADDWEYFALSYGVAVSGVICKVDETMDLQQATRLQSEMLAELVESDNLFIERKENNIEYLLDNFGTQFSFNIKLS